MKLTVKCAARFVPLLLILLFESGCTYALWTDGNLEAYKEPAQNPNLQLFQSQRRNDILVVYREHSERNDAIHTRAYWLNKNQRRVENQHAPVFARKNSARDLSPIPVFYSMPFKEDLNPSFYAVCDTNLDSFTLFSRNGELGSYRFPVYNDHWGVVEKTALTPFAVSADVTMAAGYVGILYAYCRADSGTSFSVGK